MGLELPARTIGTANKKLVAHDLKGKRIGRDGSGSGWRICRSPSSSCGFLRVRHRHLDPEHGALFRNELDLVLRCQDLESEPRVLQDNSLDANTAGAITPHNLDLSPVKLGSAQFRSGTRSTVDLAAEDLADVAKPEAVQRHIGRVLLSLARDGVKTEGAALT